MSQARDQKPFLAIWFRRSLAGAVVALMAAIIVLLVFEVRQQLEFVASSAAENVQWSLGQAETELMALELAILKAQNAPDDDSALDEVQVRFDVVYSRIGTLNTSRVLDGLRTQAVVAEQLERALAFRQSWVPVIDGADSVLRASLPEFLEETDMIRRDIRAMALNGIAYFARLGDIRRDEISNTLLRIGVTTVSLVAILLLLILAVLRLARQRELEALSNRETRERVETIISTSLDAVVVTNRAGRVIEYNGAAERVFGFSRDEAIGADMARLIVPEKFRAGHERGMQRYLESRSPRMIGAGIVQMEARRKDGSVFPVDLSLASAQSPTGEIFVAFMRDISDRVRAEQALRRARDQAIAGEQQKADLLAVMSHEMRTPLNGMLATLDLFDRDRLDDTQKRNLRIIRQSGEVLLGHVNEVLDISRLDAGQMSLSKTRFDMIALLEEILEGQAQTARARGNTLRLAPPSPALHDVYSDPDRLRQIILNLVSNAIKFTKDGTIVVETDCSAGLKLTEIRVIDTGVGIEAQDLDRIFDDFVTIDTSYTRAGTGTGLGLSISQRLAEALGGTLSAESVPGEGSVFSLQVPLVQEDAPSPNILSPHRARAAVPDAPLSEIVPETDHKTDPETASDGFDATQPPTLLVPVLDVLLVEDNDINREVGRRLLERDGHRVTEARDGAEGVAAVHARAFDVVLMDISMPGMDGVSAARAIRSSDLAWSNLPIIATTAHAMPDELQAFRAVGMDAVLTKPINLARLRNVLNTVLAGASAQDASWPDGEPLRSDTAPALLDMPHFEEMRRDLDDPRLRKALVQFGAELDAFVSCQRSQGAAFANGGLATEAAEAHRLAGSAGVFGAMPLANALRRLQAQIEHGDSGAARQTSTEVVTLWNATRASLRALGYAV